MTTFGKSDMRRKKSSRQRVIRMAWRQRIMTLACLPFISLRMLFFFSRRNLTWKKCHKAVTSSSGQTILFRVVTLSNFACVIDDNFRRNSAFDFWIFNAHFSCRTCFSSSSSWFTMIWLRLLPFWPIKQKTRNYYVKIRFCSVLFLANKLITNESIKRPKRETQEKKEKIKEFIATCLRKKWEKQAEPVGNPIQHKPQCFKTTLKHFHKQIIKLLFSFLC